MCKTRNSDLNSPRLFECEYIEVTVEDEECGLSTEEILNLLEPVQSGDSGCVLPELSDKERCDMAPVIQKVSAILYEHDPVCLNFGNNPDEYGIEACSLLAMLKFGLTEERVADAIAEVFEYYFCLEFSRYTRDIKWITMARCIWVAWTAHQEGLSDADIR
jgi:hypothetical protein